MEPIQNYAEAELESGLELNKSSYSWCNQTMNLIKGPQNNARQRSTVLMLCFQPSYKRQQLVLKSHSL